MVLNASGPVSADALTQASRAATDRIRVGCCGFPMAQARYFDRFCLVEVQQTFYQPPQSGTLARK